MSIFSSFAQGLLARGPAREYADKLALYGQFVGDWTTQTTAYLPDGGVEHSQWDARFAWVLEGRAVQDLWITPPRKGVAVPWSAPGNRYGTTLRVYDPALDAWHILWVNPPGGTIVRQLGRQVGNDIVQLGEADPNGDQVRWAFRDITDSTFRWCNEHSTDGGRTWRLLQEMRARRVG